MPYKDKDFKREYDRINIRRMRSFPACQDGRHDECVKVIGKKGIQGYLTCHCLCHKPIKGSHTQN